MGHIPRLIENPQDDCRSPQATGRQERAVNDRPQESMADYDLMTEPGARELARRIVAYWTTRGCKVDVRVQRVEGTQHLGPVWVVRSDLGLFVPAAVRSSEGHTV